MNEPDFIVSIRNWEKYQARSDKPLSWFKMWGSFFMDHRMQSMSIPQRYFCILLYHLAAQNCNRIPLFCTVLNNQYTLNMRTLYIKKFVLHLISIGFLSDQSPTKGCSEEKERKKEREDFASLSDKTAKTKAEERYERLTGKKVHQGLV